MGVTVVIPCRNMASTVERAVNSAYRAGANEVQLFDDASDDNSWQCITALCNKIETCHAQCSSHRVGVSVARNMMIEDASHQWIVPLDADDELLHIPMIPSGYQWIYGGWIEHYEDGTEETFKANGYKTLKNKPLCHATMLFNKAQWFKVGGYDPDFFYGEDYGFQCALMHAEYPPICVDYPLYKRYLVTNERSSRAKKYWPVIQQLAKEKFPAVFL